MTVESEKFLAQASAAEHPNEIIGHLNNYETAKEIERSREWFGDVMPVYQPAAVMAAYLQNGSSNVHNAIVGASAYDAHHTCSVVHK